MTTKSKEELAKEWADGESILWFADISTYTEGHKDAIRKAYLNGYEAGMTAGMQWMLKQLSKQVEISPEVLDQVTSAYQGLLKREPEGDK